MIHKFCEWLYEDKYTPADKVFDHGFTTEYALRNYYYDHKEPLQCGLDGVRDNGNGSLMRIMPAVLYANAKKYSVGVQIEFIGNVSSLTHAHKFSTASCNIYNFIAQEILNNRDDDFKSLITRGIDKSRQYYDIDEYECFRNVYGSLFSVGDDYLSGKCYVVFSLEVALYCCYHTESYREAVLKAVNIGGDTDTNAIIAGGLATLYYGKDSIPSDWMGSIIRLDYIKELCDEFYDSL